MYGHIGERIYAKTFCADYFLGLHKKSSFGNRTKLPVLRNCSVCEHVQQPIFAVFHETQRKLFILRTFLLDMTSFSLSRLIIYSHDAESEAESESDNG